VGRSLRGRVGRHAQTGVQCQNWPDDQWTIISLLNLIPAVNGGTAGNLPGIVVSGVSSDALYKAILRFQKQHFPVHQTGFVDPGGAQLARMEALSFAPPSDPQPVATPTGQWGVFQSKSVQMALYEALKDHHLLSQVMVVEILRSTLEDGIVTSEELADLKMLAENSKTIMPRSKAMLELFVKQVTEKINVSGSFVLISSQHIYAANLVCDYLRRMGRGSWPYLDRDQVGVGLLMRLAKPSLVAQRGASLCGPAAAMFNIAQDRPGLYARFAIDLYEKGEARMDYETVEPQLWYRVTPPMDLDPADWLTMGSLRSSEDLFGFYMTPGGNLSGITTPYEMAEWFRRAGYSDVTNETNLTRHQRDTEDMEEASRLYSAGYRVCLLIDAQMVDVDKEGQQSESGSALLTDRHWVVLRSKIERIGENLKFTVYTWGEGNHQVPKKGVLSQQDFLMNFYGYVSARP
jgi:hypothetical protein